MPSEAQESGPPLHWLRPLHPTTKCPRCHLPPQSRPHRHIRLRRQLPRLPREKWRADPRSRAGGLRPRRHVATGPGRRATPAEAARVGFWPCMRHQRRGTGSMAASTGMRRRSGFWLRWMRGRGWRDSLLDTILVQQYLLLVRATDSLPTAGGGHHLFLNLEWFLSLHWFSSGEISLSPCHEGSR
ncbi:hypothetical protein GX48_00105 [Paracoccidioides brasiliensis]|nr:hypothetical protein GX48_00105 [Paracoccidioides brasiliensis]